MAETMNKFSVHLSILSSETDQAGRAVPFALICLSSMMLYERKLKFN